MAENEYSMNIEGVNILKATLAQLGEEAPGAIAGPLYRFARQHVMLPAKRRYVPVVTGALRNSINTSNPTIRGNAVEVVIGAGGAAAPYALSVHENPRAGKTGGRSPSGKKYKRWSRVGQWKYLETPLKEAAGHPGPFLADLQAEVQKLLRKRGR